MNKHQKRNIWIFVHASILFYILMSNIILVMKGYIKLGIINSFLLVLLLRSITELYNIKKVAKDTIKTTERKE